MQEIYMFLPKTARRWLRVKPPRPLYGLRSGRKGNPSQAGSLGPARNRLIGEQIFERIAGGGEAPDAGGAPGDAARETRHHTFITKTVFSPASLRRRGNAVRLSENPECEGSPQALAGWQRRIGLRFHQRVTPNAPLGAGDAATIFRRASPRIGDGAVPFHRDCKNQRAYDLTRDGMCPKNGALTCLVWLGSVHGQTPLTVSDPLHSMSPSM